MPVSPAVPLPGKTDASINASFIIPGHLELEVDRLEVGANHDEILRIVPLKLNGHFGQKPSKGTTTKA